MMASSTSDVMSGSSKVASQLSSASPAVPPRCHSSGTSGSRASGVIAEWVQPPATDIRIRIFRARAIRLFLESNNS